MRLGVISTSVRDAALDGAALLVNAVGIRAATALVSTFSLLGRVSANLGCLDLDRKIHD